MTNVIKFERKQKAEPVEQPEEKDDVLRQLFSEEEIRTICKSSAQSVLNEINTKIAADEKAPRIKTLVESLQRRASKRFAAKNALPGEIKAIASHVNETMLAEIDARIKAGKNWDDE